MKKLFFGDDTNPKRIRVETMLEYTNRVGLFSNTFYVPIIAYFPFARSITSMIKNNSLTRSSILIQAFTCYGSTLILTHTAFYMANLFFFIPAERPVYDD